MTLNERNAVRKQYLDKVLALFEGEDVGLIASNKFNFPIVHNEEEGWIEITISLTKEDGDSGYMKREEYDLKQKKAADRVAEKEKKKKKGEEKKGE